MASKDRPVTMAQVGRRAGVSDRTVSNVLSGKIPVRPSTRDAVLQAVRELGYQMNVSARSLRTGRTGCVTLALPDLANDYFSELADAVLTEADRLGWAVTVYQTGTRRDRELSLLAGARHHFSDGLLLLPLALDSDDAPVLLSGTPTVLLGERVFTAELDHVTMDNTAAARAATEHLLQVGCRRIVALGPNPADTSPTAATLRLCGYRQALAAAGASEDRALLVPGGRWTADDGAIAVGALIDHDVPFDGIFCFNDSLAIGALHALNRRGVRVPQEVAVMGFDNVAAAAYTHPPLSTIDAGTGDIARMAARRLVGRIDGTYQGRPEVLVPRFRVVQRDSTRRQSSRDDELPRSGLNVDSK